jgi:hypothetical protein
MKSQLLRFGIVIGGSSLADIACITEDEYDPAPVESQSGEVTGLETGTGGFPEIGVPCDIWAPACGGGEKCMPMAFEGYLYTEARCVAVVASPSLVGEPCSMPYGPLGGADDCDESSFCYYYDVSANSGICVPFCTGTPASPNCPGDTVCGYDLAGTLALCREPCDPIEQDCPFANSVCRDVNDNVHFGCFVDASGEEDEPPGDLASCSVVNGCAAGQVCVPEERARLAGGAGFACTPYCDTSLPDDCPLAEQQCIQWIPGAIGNDARIGACLVP